MSIDTLGLSLLAKIPAPRNPVSSCVVAAPRTLIFPGIFLSLRITSAVIYTPILSSRDSEQIRSFSGPNSRISLPILYTQSRPVLIPSASAAFLSCAPIDRTISSTFSTVSRSLDVSRCIAFFIHTAGIVAPESRIISNLCPGITFLSSPLFLIKCRKP